MDADCCLLRLPAVLAAAAAAAAEDNDYLRSRSCISSSSGRIPSSPGFRPPWRICLGEGIFLRRSAQKWVWVRSLQESAEMGVSDEEEGRFSKSSADCDVGESGELFADSAENRRESSSCSSEMTSSGDSRQSSDALPLGWPCRNLSIPEKKSETSDDGAKLKPGSVMSGSLVRSSGYLCSVAERFFCEGKEVEMVKERFAKLLLGEDMSGCGKGVCPALSISNAVTNLCGSVFGKIWRLEPLPAEKKALWRREMEWLLCVSDYIVELTPSVQNFPDGTKLEVMSCRQRSDLFMDLPALRKLDNMLLEILDEFRETEFWYVDQGILTAESDDGNSRTLKRQEEKWWLPVPRVPACGLPETERKKLKQKRESTNQILKAAMAINSNALAEMEIPKSYVESLPKTGKTALGETIYRYITSEQFSPECLLDYLDLSSEHRALEIANRVEAAMFVWRRRETAPPRTNGNRWGGMVRDLVGDAERRELLADRAESLLICLKQRFPSLTQTTLDMTKIQCNKDVGKSILESYSRVLESLASNVIARIDDLLYVDDLTKKKLEGKLSPSGSKPALKRSSATSTALVPVSSTTATPYATPSFSPAKGRGGRTPFLLSRKAAPPHARGFGVKKVLTDYLGVSHKSGGANSNVADNIK